QWTQPRQLQVHPVDGGHEQHERDRDRLEREDERESDRRPELLIVDDGAVGAERAGLSRLVVLEAEEERRDRSDQEVRGADQRRQNGRRRNVTPGSHRAHGWSRRWSGTYSSIIAASTQNIPSASACAKCGFERKSPV